MTIEIKTTGEDKNREGTCPSCGEWTTAGDSCCGDGAYVEGSLMSDESAQDDIENPTVCVRLLTEVTAEKANALRDALFAAGLSSSMFGNSMFGRLNEDKWSVNLFVSVDAFPGYVPETPECTQDHGNAPFCTCGRKG